MSVRHPRVGCLIDPSIVIRFPICCKNILKSLQTVSTDKKCQYAPKKRPQKENHSERRQTASKRLKQKMQYCQIKFGFSFFARCWSERSSRRMSRRLREDTWRPWIFILLCHFCDYYVIIISHSHVASMRGPKTCKICFGYASFVLNVVCLLSLWFSFCGRFFGA